MLLQTILRSGRPDERPTTVAITCHVPERPPDHWTCAQTCLSMELTSGKVPIQYTRLWHGQLCTAQIWGGGGGARTYNAADRDAVDLRVREQAQREPRFLWAFGLAFA